MTSFDWDGPQDVGDRLEIGFQVVEMQKFSEIPLCPHNFLNQEHFLGFQAHFSGNPPDLIYADFDGPDHPICGSCK